MTVILSLLVALPVGAFALTAWTVRPRAAHIAAALDAGPLLVAPRRLALVRAGLIIGGYGVIAVEVLSAIDALSGAGIAVTWLLAVALAGTAAALRRRSDRASDTPGGNVPVTVPRAGRRPRWRELWRDLPRVDRLLVGGIAALVLAELILAVASAPNTYDSQTYHLPKIEQWAARGSVEVFPARIHRQITFPPGAEYLLLHARLLTGGDALYALLQWAAGLGCLAAVTRLVAQLGGGRRPQLFAGFVFATTPMVVLQSSSTQTDLVVAAWTAALVTLATDGVNRPIGTDGVNRPIGTGGGDRVPLLAPGAGTVVLFGLALGIIAVTKTTGLLGAAPFLLWWGLAALRRSPHRLRAVGGLAAATAVMFAIALVIAGPFLFRVYDQFGNPLGPDYARGSVAMERHDPAAVLINGLRQAHTVFDTPVAPVRRWAADGIESFGQAIGVRPDDPAITFDRTTFPDAAWYPSEDKAAYPVQALLVLIGVGYCALRGDPRRRGYAAAVVCTALLVAASVKWQPWGNRLMLFAFVLATPLAGFALDAATRAWRARPSATGEPARRPASGSVLAGAATGSVLAGAATALLAVGMLAGSLSAAYGWPRRLVGAQSALVLDEWDSRFVSRPEWADQYRRIADAVDASGARRIGLVQTNDTWEYPWWVRLGGEGRVFVPLQSMAPKVPAESNTDIDALLCNATVHTCAAYLPPNWRLVMVSDEIGYALPPVKG